MSRPSVYIAPTTFRQDTLNITIRGQRNFDAPSGGGNPGLGFDTASAVYKDGVYYARAIGLTGSLFDLDNVAVLKGPQGTLVGRNTTGGAILYTSRDPGPDFGGYVQATVGRLWPRRPAGRGQYSPGRHAVPARGAEFGKPEGLYRQSVHGSRHRAPQHPGRDGLQEAGAACFRSNGSRTTASMSCCAPTSPPSMTPAPAITIWALSPARCRRRARPRSATFRRPASASPTCAARSIAPFYLTATATSVSNPNPSPLTYNTPAQFGGARAEGRLLERRSRTSATWCQGHYETYSATANKTFGDVDVKLMGAYRTFSNSGTAVSRGQPFESQHLCL